MSNVKSPNRDILETVILPWFASWPSVRRVLFVGCAEYTCGYENQFEGHDYYTIDVDPCAATYGTRRLNHHFVDSIEHVDRYFQPASLHAILLNGVIGYGLDDQEQAEKTVAISHELLAEGGILMIGWNDLPQCKPFDPLSLAEWGRFDRLEVPALAATLGVRRLGSGDYLVDDDYQHVFSFFKKVRRQSSSNFV